MVKPKIYVTRKLPSERAMKLLFEYCDVDLNEESRPPTKEELIEHVKDKDGLLCLLTDKIDKDVLDAAPKLKVISTYSVGYDHIDVEEATKRGIYVTYTPGVLTDAVADHTWALLLAVARRLVEADQCVRQGCWKIAWAPDFMLGTDVYGKTLGIIGLGRIGTAVARRAKGFNMRILYYDKERKLDVEKELGVEFRSLDEVLKESDFVVISVVLTKETYHMIGERELRLMKPTAYLINIARGAIVDTNALVKALEEGWIAGAALDVFEEEPLPKDHPLTKFKNVILTPHIAAFTKEAIERMDLMVAEDVVRACKGLKPRNIANPEVLEKINWIRGE